jgi:putative oxidoreductase
MQQMGVSSVLVAFTLRLLLVLIFLPFSALDKILNYCGAVGQAREAVDSTSIATILIAVGFLVEVIMSLGVITGIADRAAAFVLAGYCGVTAILWKQFWTPDDFWTVGKSRARGLFWDFLKNFALAGGLLLITFGTGASTVDAFFSSPLSSSHPYQLEPE